MMAASWPRPRPLQCPRRTRARSWWDRITRAAGTGYLIGGR